MHAVDGNRTQQITIKNDHVKTDIS